MSSVLTLPDNRDRLFGRQDDIAYLLDRVRQMGLTVVSAPPQYGKTWLLLEVARTLDSAELAQIGYARNTGRPDGALKLAIADLVNRWLDRPPHAKQLGQLKTWLSRGDIYVKSCGVVSALLKLRGLIPEAAILAATEASAIDASASSGIDVSIDGVVTGQVAVGNHIVQIGRMDGGLVNLAIQHRQFEPLLYEDVLNVATAIGSLTRLPVVLVLDAWEKTSSIAESNRPLESFLSESASWPACHFLLGLRTPDVADPSPFGHADVIKRLCAQSSRAEYCELAPMRLGSESEKARLLWHVRSVLPCLTHVEDETVLKYVGGLPAVLDRWRNLESSAGVAEAVSATDDARQGVYAELDKVLYYELSVGDRALATCVALLPQLPGAEQWSRLKAEVMGDTDPACFDTLRRIRVLKQESYPTFGHDTRHSAALKWLLREDRQFVSEQANRLVMRLSKRLSGIDELPYEHAAVLGALSIAPVDLLPLTKALAVSAAAIFRENQPDSSALLGLTALKPTQTMAPLLSIGLFHSFYRARLAGSSARQQALLQELRFLYQLFPDVPEVREYLVMGLFHATEDAMKRKRVERRNQLIEEMIAVQKGCPHDVAVAKHSAGVLYNALEDSTSEMKYRVTILSELRRLRDGFPSDSEISKIFGWGLHVAAFYQFEQGQSDLLLLKDLREVCSTKPDDLEARRFLAIGLSGAVRGCKEIEARRTYVEELAQLDESFPADPNVYEWFAAALYNYLEALADDDIDARDQCLRRLRKLHEDHAKSTVVRGNLAAALGALATKASNEGRTDSRQPLLDDLRELCRRCPDDSYICMSLALTIFNSSVDSINNGNMTNLGSMLGELRALNSVHPAEPIIRGILAEVLDTALVEAIKNRGMREAELIFEELRGLYEGNVQNADVRELYERAITRMLGFTQREGAPSKAGYLSQLSEMRKRFPEDAFWKCIRRLSPEEVKQRQLLIPKQDNSWLAS